MLELFVTRHGETDWNAQQRIQGSMDIGLNAKGHKQAEALGIEIARYHQECNFKLAFCSDMARTRDTAAPGLGAIGLACDFSPVWRERCFGVLEGLSQAEVDAKHPVLAKHWRNRSSGTWLPGGESLEALRLRIAGAMQGIQGLYCAEQTHRVWVVTHGGVLDAMHRIARDLPMNTPRDFSIGNCELNRLQFDGSRWRVVFWGGKPYN